MVRLQNSAIHPRKSSKCIASARRRLNFPGATVSKPLNSFLRAAGMGDESGSDQEDDPSSRPQSLACMSEVLTLTR